MTRQVIASSHTVPQGIERSRWCSRLVLILLSGLAVGNGIGRTGRADEPPPGGTATLASASDEAALGQGDRGGDEHLRELIAQLDDAHFATRNHAARQLMQRQKPAIPYLVEALTDRSGELRLRAQVLLARYERFEDLAPHLARAACRPQGALARGVLQAHAAGHLERAFELPHSEKLFQFWGKKRDVFQEEIRSAIAAAKTVQEAERAIDPLLAIDDKVAQFNRALNRLEALSLPYQHTYSPGLIIAQTLARGLHDNDADWIAFAERHLEAFETLGDKLRARGRTAHEVRTETAERANMSQGAASYLVQILTPGSAEEQLYRRFVPVLPEQLKDAFFSGLEHPEARECERRVGKLHIADMLGDVLVSWADPPAEGTAPRLVAEIVQTIETGNKPKALALLDALEAGRNLPNQKLSAAEGLGRQLFDRLGSAAIAATDNRVYFPARYLHDRFLNLVASGITPSDPAFPADALASHLAGDVEGMSDERRLALERYVRLLERLKSTGMTRNQPGVARFLAVMSESIVRQPDVLGRGLAELDRLAQNSSAQAAEPESLDLDQALGLLAKTIESGMRP